MADREDSQQQEDEKRRVQVDEDWKKSVAEEKQKLREEQQDQQQARPAGQQEPTFPEPTIQVLLAGLYTQTLAALGALENPLTGKRQKSIAEAAYLIDTISMLKDKTEGNLTAEESSYVESILYDLRIRYVAAVGPPAGEQQGPQPQKS